MEGESSAAREHDRRNGWRVAELCVPRRLRSPFDSFNTLGTLSKLFYLSFAGEAAEFMSHQNLSISHLIGSEYV